MPDWLNRWIGKPRAESPFASRLRGYPPYDAPFVGYGLELSEAEAQVNLAYFERVLAQRLECLAELLRELAGLDIAAALAAPQEHAAPLTEALHLWAAAQWPPLQAEHPSLNLRAWLASRRSGDDIVFSMLLDVAILLGELVRRANPDWRWGLDLDTANLRDDMVSARRVVLLAEPVGTLKAPLLIDVEDVVVHRFLHPTDLAQQRLNPWRRLVDEGIRGDAMAYWRTTMAPPTI
jgi:hypothetical protein